MINEKKNPEFCHYCKKPVWDWEWIEKTVEGEKSKHPVSGMIVCTKHRVRGLNDLGIRE